MLWPIIVPSYKRGSNAKTLKLLLSDERLKNKVWLYIYKDDSKNYQTIIDSNFFNIKYCEGFRGIVQKRNFINQTMLDEGFENIFVLDDDISALYETFPSVQKKDPTKYRSEKKQLKPFDFFEKLQSTIEKANKHITQTGICFETASWCYDLRTKDKIVYYSFPIQLVHLNIKDLNENNIIYREGYWDDYDLSLQILNNNLLTAEIKNMTYAVEPMKLSSSVSNSSVEKWATNSFNLYQTYGNNVRFIVKNEILNAKPVRRNIIRNLEEGRKLDEPIYDLNNLNKLKKWNEYIKEIQNEN